jgi:hypothetical protein
MPRLPASQSDPQIDQVLLKILTDLTDAIRLLILVELAGSDNERENIRKIVLAQRVNQRDNKKLVECSYGPGPGYAHVVLLLPFGFGTIAARRSVICTFAIVLY